jgi:nicotinate-nucleotide pyrophosphorylase (carboxylating)
MNLSAQQIEPLVRAALLEDAPWGDVTSQTFIPADARVSARLVAREAGVLAGQDVFTTAIKLAGDVSITFTVGDGVRFENNEALATIEGPGRAVLQAERVALNFIQRLSGTATLTALYVAEAAGTAARITDTRKTTPGLRLLERYAVRCGGGYNHRFSLSDAVMLKDNHLAIVTASLNHKQTEPGALSAALREAAARLPHTMHIEIEVDRLDQIEPILSSGIVGTLMLDNFADRELAEAVALARKLAPRVLIEASGGVTLQRIRAIAAAGVDLISVGALTHSARALDLALDFDE